MILRFCKFGLSATFCPLSKSSGLLCIVRYLSKIGQRLSQVTLLKLSKEEKLRENIKYFMPGEFIRK